MGRKATIFPTTVLVLVALLGWPWNILIAAQQTQDLGSVSAPCVRAAASPFGGTRLGKTHRFNVLITPASLTADEQEREEGDGAGSFEPSAFALTSPTASRAGDPARLTTVAAGPYGQASPFSRLCRYRC